MNNSRESSRDDNTPADKNGEKEQHKFQFRGAFIPAEILHQLIEKRLTKTELLLLVLVDSLVTCRGEGCWATNAYLAESVGCSESHARNSLARLEKDGLIRRTTREKNGQQVRFLEAAWSRLGEEKTPPKTGSGGGAEKSAGGAEKSAGGVLKNQHQKDNTTYCPILNKNSDCPPPEAGDEVSTSKGFFQVPGPKVSSFDLECAKLLYKRLGEVNKLVSDNSSAARWAHDFKKLRLGLDDDRARIRKVLDWYVAHIGEAFVPEAFCADSFREKFVRIEARMDPSSTQKAQRAEAEEKERKRKLMDW